MFVCSGYQWRITILFTASALSTAFGAWTPIVVRKITELGPQLSPSVTNVSRDGGYSSLINGNVVWAYDDTECFDHEGNQLSFISNTASYSDQPNQNISNVADFGVIEVRKDKNGEPLRAILADTSVGTGGWIPFQPDELDFNNQKKGKERVAIWPGTSPTSVNPEQALLFAPLVYVDSKPKDLAKQYSARGMTLITVTAPKHGPIATRQGDLLIPGTEVSYGGFSTLIGFKSTGKDSDTKDRDVYVIGIADNGLQLARVGINDIRDWNKYTFYDPEKQVFSHKSPKPTGKDPKKSYLPGTYSSGSVFYSPYFNTFVMIYFNKMADSTFYMRYLDLDRPLKADSTWSTGGRNGAGIVPEDAEALVKYAWSAEQKLWTSPTMKGGFNYAGIAHPEFFNRHYFAPTLYSENLPKGKRMNEWYGASLIKEANAGGYVLPSLAFSLSRYSSSHETYLERLSLKRYQTAPRLPETGNADPKMSDSDGKNLLLSWTAQLQSGTNNGIYQVQLALLEFDAIPSKASQTASGSASSSKHGPQPINTALNMMEEGQGQSLIPVWANSREGWHWRPGVVGLALLLLGSLGVGALGW